MLGNHGRKLMAELTERNLPTGKPHDAERGANFLSDEGKECGSRERHQVTDHCASVP